MNDAMDDAVDLLLRQQFEGPVPDDGFCESIMQQLPARRRRNTWPLVAGILAGIATCWFSLWSTPIAQKAWQDWFAGDSSLAIIVLFGAMSGMAILAMFWAVIETDDRFDPRSRRPIP